MKRDLAAPYRDKSIADVAILGAGVIGMSLALEMQARGARVVVIERGRALGRASIAAAGMLAADDTSNPLSMLALARFSAALYPAFLRRIERLAQMPVPFQTEVAWQYAEKGQRTQLVERSIDPRQLAAALEAAVRSTPIELLEGTVITNAVDMAHGVNLSTANGDAINARQIVFAVGAWAGEDSLAGPGCHVPIVPRKGQMLRVKLPGPLSEVHRSEQVYIVPRTTGPQAGTALIGATVEDAGFDVTVHADDLARLRGLAAELLPALAVEADAPMVEAWAGLRPATQDMLPVLGLCGSERRFIASGHYRNGILLAPATAVVLADLLCGKTPSIAMEAFSPARFSR